MGQRVLANPFSKCGACPVCDRNIGTNIKYISFKCYLSLLVYYKSHKYLLQLVYYLTSPHVDNLTRFGFKLSVIFFHGIRLLHENCAAKIIKIFGVFCRITFFSDYWQSRFYNNLSFFHQNFSSICDRIPFNIFFSSTVHSFIFLWPFIHIFIHLFIPVLLKHQNCYFLHME